MRDELPVSEVFRSIQGETTRAGLPCTFVRTAGCNLHCAWCDTEYARTDPGTRVSVGQVLADVEAFGTRLVCITGGEPLLQAGAVASLADGLLRAGRTVLLETNGSLDTSPAPDGVVRILDVKCPGSGECGTTLDANVAALRPCDEAKFVLADRRDFEWAAAFVRERGLEGGPHLLFAPVHGRLDARTLAGWILEAGIEARLQLQLHKILWPERDRGV
jgi:7-carboxy-7-deazaguanine synthase